MQDPINTALVDAVERLESETSLAPALPVISEMADIDASRMTLEACVEQITMADGSVVDILEAEQTYREWRASHRDMITGNAQTGEALVQELRVAMEMLHRPSMESDLIRSLKRTFGTMATLMKTFGKDLVAIRNEITKHKEAIEAKPVLLDSISSYNFLTRDNKPVKGLDTAIDEDLEFIKACEVHYKHLFELSTSLSKRFREACNSDSESDIRDAIDQFDEALLDRTEFNNLTKFHLLGNRMIYLDKRGYPQYRVSKSLWKFTTKEADANNLVTQLATKKIHGFSIGGPVKSVRGVAGINVVAAQKQVVNQVKAGGGETDVSAFISMLDDTIALNNQVVKFAQMAAAMGERITRMSSDMDDAYNRVNTEKTEQENAIRVRELRSLHRAARRSVSQYMFLGKSIATMMEDHASYVYRNITLIANDVLKKTVKDPSK
jgi:hypothetical protein